MKKPVDDPALDPTEDPNFPRIVAYQEDDEPDWPLAWEAEPTERDNAAIAAQEDQSWPST